MDTAEESIKDGTVVFFSGKSFIQKLIRWATSGKWCHCGIAFWMYDCATNTKRLMLIESDFGGVRLVNLNSRSGPVALLDADLDWASVVDSAISSAGKITYANRELLMIGLKDILRRNGLALLASKLPEIDKKGMVCSEFVAAQMNKSGWEIDTQVSPNDLFQLLQTYSDPVFINL